jgi:hypothetical protein
VLSAEAEQVFASRSLRHGSRSNNGRMIPRSTPYDSRRKSRFRNQCTEQPTAYRSGPFLLVRHPRSRSDRLNASLNASKGRDEDWANRFSTQSDVLPDLICRKAGRSNGTLALSRGRRAEDL